MTPTKPIPTTIHSNHLSHTANNNDIAQLQFDHRRSLSHSEYQPIDRPPSVRSISHAYSPYATPRRVHAAVHPIKWFRRSHPHDPPIPVQKNRRVQPTQPSRKVANHSSFVHEILGLPDTLRLPFATLFPSAHDNAQVGPRPTTPSDPQRLYLTVLWTHHNHLPARLRVACAKHCPGNAT